MKIARGLKSLWVVTLIVMILGATMAFTVWFQFNPSNSLELTPAKATYRLIAVAIDSADGTVLVKACDWPHTLFSPFILGDASSPDKYTSAKCYWSNDGTLAVWEIQEGKEITKLYSAAYDFRHHVGIDLKEYNWNAQDCHEAIAALVTERGGVAPSAIDIPYPNSGLYEQ
jgi:hypothetical protein